jgi:hypothetical protein
MELLSCRSNKRLQKHGLVAWSHAQPTKGSACGLYPEYPGDGPVTSGLSGGRLEVAPRNLLGPGLR